MFGWFSADAVAHFLLEPADALGVVDKVRSKKLQRGFAFQAHVPRL
jgi:hypothetical protein